jgi:hypothetical protein
MLRIWDQYDQRHSPVRTEHERQFFLTVSEDLCRCADWNAFSKTGQCSFTFCSV